ncbi:UBC-like protein [Coleophoma cylindrospora]|uniref:UBC-like protein n=1 Tax=Coleophoma cylindrospora TaxID=1849047 RepID=A0A3D8S053_9HELO|nr:UBC-like protein [Coleophoma cylindrospora]
MAPRLSSLSVVRRQRLLVEFSSLKYACPHGVFMSLTPGDATLWSGVIFVRKGPYAPALLRFQISFPPTYPDLPPLVTFSTDIFHPLITPLTTYLYTTDVQAEGTVSATDEERLPPGGMSLRHGFPTWFGRTTRSRQSAKNHTPIRGGSVTSEPSSAASTSPTPRQASGSTAGTTKQGREPIAIYEVLRYIRSAFDDEEVLDNVPLEAAGNPGAWHAWRSHRVKSGKFLAPPPPPKDWKGGIWHEGGSDDEGSASSSGTPEGYQRLAGGTSGPLKPGAQGIARRPGEWNWEGVWEVRVKKGIDNSIAEAVLYGSASPGDDLIQFLNKDEEEIETIKQEIQRSVETVEPMGRGVV